MLNVELFEFKKNWRFKIENSGRLFNYQANIFNL